MKTSSQVESWGGDLVDFQVVLVPSQVVNANPSDSQVYDEFLVTTATHIDLFSFTHRRTDELCHERKTSLTCVYVSSCLYSNTGSWASRPMGCFIHCMNSLKFVGLTPAVIDAEFIQKIGLCSSNVYGAEESTIETFGRTPQMILKFALRFNDTCRFHNFI